MKQETISKTQYWASTLTSAPARILLVDDSEEDNFIHKRHILRHFPQCEVHSVGDGQQALDFLLNRDEQTYNVT